MRIRFHHAACVYPCEFKASFMPETGSAIVGAGCAAGGSARQRSCLIEEDALVKMVHQQRAVGPALLIFRCSA
jgi:hypothetical protein